MDDILTVEEAMAYLKIGRSTLLKLTRDGQIPARKVGRAWRYTKENLQAYVAGELENLPAEETKIVPKEAKPKKTAAPKKAKVQKPAFSPKIRPNNDPGNTLKSILEQFNEED